MECTAVDITVATEEGWGATYDADLTMRNGAVMGAVWDTVETGDETACGKWNTGGKETLTDSVVGNVSASGLSDSCDPSSSIIWSAKEGRTDYVTEERAAKTTREPADSWLDYSD